MGFLPAWIYEPLPYLYTLAGLAAAIGLDSWGGRAAGILLATAGFLIYKMRRDYRQASSTCG